MSWRRKIIFDKKRRSLVKKYELDSMGYKFLSSTFLYHRNENYIFSYNYMLFKGILAYKSRIINRCILTNKVRWVFRAFKLARMAFKEKATKRLLMGVRRAKW